VSLVNLQRAMAVLFTDAEARALYERDQRVFTELHSLSDGEAAQLAALSASAIASYAATLVRKRRSEAIRLLPSTRSELNEGFAKAFDCWVVRTPVPSGAGRHTADALAFCKYIRASRATFSVAVRRAAGADARRLRPPILRTLLARH
jgi:hypothetical protein